MRLQRLLRRVQADIKQPKDVLEFGHALVQQGHVLQLRAEARLEGRHEPVEVGVEDDELPQDGGQAGQQGRERRGLGLLELRLAPEAVRWRSRSVREQDAGEGEGTHIAIWPGSRG